ncbi:hypothetical protein NDI76_13550 [Halogeometricum sp. S1BR25-6]|uniref:Uncharacterized protein n=1 Tax=Halogeometricum salsisoli TaxID=2950536 RepID=A0ABU2GHV4_9EURY|nr:hypothetical protein [Halogeometricum sp. S1BR25-6]MDS0299769.1 hypothetical protein [Halogeometricum sp. S1BR25-6]
MSLTGAPAVRRNAAAGAVCATLLVAVAEFLVPLVFDGAADATARYALALLAFALWMTWFVLTGVAVLADDESAE